MFAAAAGSAQERYVRTNQVGKFLIELFSKSSRGGGRGALLARRNGRNKPRRFLFAKPFSFAPAVSKEKAAVTSLC